jgi:hypothetical protein
MSQSHGARHYAGQGVQTWQVLRGFWHDIAPLLGTAGHWTPPRFVASMHQREWDMARSAALVPCVDTLADESIRLLFLRV